MFNQKYDFIISELVYLDLSDYRVFNINENIESKKYSIGQVIKSKLIDDLGHIVILKMKKSGVFMYGFLPDNNLVGPMQHCSVSDQIRFKEKYKDIALKDCYNYYMPKKKSKFSQMKDRMSSLGIKGRCEDS